jgi:capsular exopolysaccharide synthesis family protein
LDVEAYPRFDARQVGRTLWRRAPLIAALVIVAAVATYAFSSLLPKTYVAVASVRVDTSSQAFKAASNGGSTDQQLMNNEVFLAKGAAVRAAGAQAIGPDNKAVISVNVTQVTNSDIISFAVTSHDPTAAANAANAYSQAYVKTRQAQIKSNFLAAADRAKSQADSYQNDIAAIGNCHTPTCEAQRTTLAQQEGQQLALWNTNTDQAERSISIVTVVRSAVPPTVPTSPTPLRDAGIAAGVALIFGVGLAFLLEQLDNRVKTPEDVARAGAGVPLLGQLPAYSDGRRHLTRRFHRAERALVPPTSTAAESYFALATSLRFSSLGKEKRTILVTSSVGEEGKTTITANLAAVLAESGFRVVVVSADLRRPMLGELLHSSETQKGLTSAMLGDRELAACFVSVPLPSGKNIFVLPAGPLPHEPAVLLGSDTFGTVLEQIKRSQADFILIDCAPVLPVSDPVAASRHVDGVIVLALHGETRKSDLAETVERLRQVDADIIGVVLNGVPQVHGRFDYYGYYGYRAEAASTNGASTNGTKPGTPATNGKSAAHADPAATAPPPPDSAGSEPHGDAG